MTGKWIQPFPDNVDLNKLEIHSTSDKPWLDVEIEHGRSIANIRRIDLSLGQRLKVQLKLAQAWRSSSPRFSGQHLKIQLHDEDPGAGFLRIDAPVGADLDASLSSQTLLPGIMAMKNSGSNCETPPPCMEGSTTCHVLADQRQEAKTSLQTTWT